jgi:hypothetical protein
MGQSFPVFVGQLHVIGNTSRAHGDDSSPEKPADEGIGALGLTTLAGWLDRKEGMNPLAKPAQSVAAY